VSYQRSISGQTFVLTFYFIAFRFTGVMEAIEPISARIVSATYNFIQHVRTAVSHKTAIANLQCDFHIPLLVIFSQLFHDFLAISPLCGQPFRHTRCRERTSSFGLHITSCIFYCLSLHEIESEIFCLCLTEIMRIHLK